jgi:TonB family protein
MRVQTPGDGGTGRGDWRDVPTGVPGGTGSGNGSGGDHALPSSGVGSGAGPIPRLPGLALLEGLLGIVEVAVQVETDGSVGKVTITKRSDYDALDNAAVRAARAWAFRPAFEHGKAVTATVRMRFLFTKEKVTVTQL